ncbi:hypothetical protein D9M68_782840 [compost metagenome]
MSRYIIANAEITRGRQAHFFRTIGFKRQIEVVIGTNSFQRTVVITILYPGGILQGSQCLSICQAYPFSPVIVIKTRCNRSGTTTGCGRIIYSHTGHMCRKRPGLIGSCQRYAGQ